MRLRLMAIGLLAAALHAAPRDPFQPLASSLCPTPPEALDGWRLVGVLGREPDWRGWLRSPQARLYALSAAQPLPLAGWRLRAITRRTLTLTAGEGCLPHTFTLSLQGSTYAQDGTSAAGVALLQPGAGSGRR